MDSTHPSWNEALVDVVIDFTEAAVHSLLHARRVYPQAIFERRRKYGVPVWMSRHPSLNDYIYQVLLRTKDLISQGVVRKILVCFFEEGTNDESRPLEKIAFELRMNQKGTVSAASDEPGLTSRSQDDDSVDQSTLQDIEDQLRSALLQIGKSSAHLPSRQGCTFGLHVQAQEGVCVGDGGEDHENRDGASTVRSALRGGHWLLADDHAQGVMTKSGQRFLVPIKSVRGPGLRLDLSSEMGDCYVES